MEYRACRSRHRLAITREDALSARDILCPQEFQFLPLVFLRPRTYVRMFPEIKNLFRAQTISVSKRAVRGMVCHVIFLHRQMSVLMLPAFRRRGPVLMRSVQTTEEHGTAT